VNLRGRKGGRFLGNGGLSERHVVWQFLAKERVGVLKFPVKRKAIRCVYRVLSLLRYMYLQSCRRHKNHHRGRQAMQEEQDSLDAHEVMEYVPRPFGQKVIPGTGFFL
jgi:hypothetical protein